MSRKMKHSIKATIWLLLITPVFYFCLYKIFGCHRCEQQMMMKQNYSINTYVKEEEEELYELI